MGGVGVAFELAHPSAFASSLREIVDKLRLFGLKDFIAWLSHVLYCLCRKLHVLLKKVSQKKLAIFSCRLITQVSRNH